MATQRTRYANTDVSGGAGNGTSLADAYSSMSVLEAAEDDLGNLVSRDEWLDVRVYATSGTADTTKCVWGGWTLDSTRYVKVSCPQTKAATWSTSIYRLSVSNDDALSFQSAGRFDVEDLQVEVTDGDSTNDEVISGLAAAAITLNLKRVFARGGSGSICTCYSFLDADVTFNMESCIGQAGHANGRSVYATLSTGTMLHCTFYGGASGFRSGANTGTYTLTNCIVGETADDFIVGAGSTVTIDHCCSDDGDGTNAIDPGVGGVIGAMTDPANGDFTIDADSAAYHTGTDLSVSLDYISAAFHSTTPSVGAFEYIPAASDTYSGRGVMRGVGRGVMR